MAKTIDSGIVDGLTIGTKVSHCLQYDSNFMSNNEYFVIFVQGDWKAH